MLLRPGRPLLAIRAFILASPVCTASAPLVCTPSVLGRGTVPSHYRPKRQRLPGRTTRFSTTNEHQKPVPYALTSAARSFEEQVLREELTFLPHAYEHLRQVVLEAQRGGFSLADADAPVLSEDVVMRVMLLLTTSPQRGNADLQLAIYNDLLPLFHIHAEVAHPLEFAAQTFQEHVQAGALDSLPHIYDHLQHLAEAVPEPRKVFVAESAAWRAISWMQRLMGGQQTDLLPRILHDLPRLFNFQPTLAHHQLVIKGFLARDMPDEAWAWLRNMEQHEGTEHTAWLKPNTELYDLFLKYFAKRGDVVPVRMLLEKMPRHAAPSQLSYHLLIAAILAKPAPAAAQRANVEAAVKEMKLKGHSMHLKTLGGAMGRGPLASWLSKEVFDVLRAAQAQSNARAKGLQSIVHERGGEMSDEVKTSKKQESEKDDDGLSTSPTSNVDIVQEPPEISRSTMPLLVAPDSAEATQVPPHFTLQGNDNPSLPQNLECPFLQDGAPPASRNVVSPLDAMHENCTFHIRIDSDGGRHETAVALHTEELTEDRGRRSWHMFEAMSEENNIPLAGAAKVIQGEISHVENEVFTDVQEAPSNSSSLYGRPCGTKVTQLPHDGLAILNVKLEPPHVENEEPRGVNYANPQRKIDGEASDSLTNPPQATSLPGSQPQPSTTLTTSLPLPNEPVPLSPRVRLKYSRLFYNALRHGDFRDASKIYAELTAVTGPDAELGGAMIKSLCQGHLLKAPPRPHIMQALRIYRSLVDVEKHVTAKGFFDGASRENSGHAISNKLYEDLLRALSASAPAGASFRDYPQVYGEYAKLAIELLSDMKTRHMWPDSRTLVSILVLQFRAAKTHQEAFQHYKSVVEDIHSAELARSDKTANANNIASRLTLRPSEYKTILNAFTKVSFPDAPVAPAHLWFSIADDMRARGFAVTVEDYTRYLARISGTRITPQVVEQVSANTALPSAAERRVDSMYVCVKHMHNRLVLDANISPDAYLLNTLMNAYQHLGAFEDALSVFNTIWLSGRMDNVTPIIIFDACGHTGRQDIAYMIWCLLVSKGWKFDKRTIDTWVECLCRGNVEAACRFVCVYMGRENAGYLSEGDTRPDVQTCLILLKLSWLRGQNTEVKEKIRTHLPHLWDKLAARNQ